MKINYLMIIFLLCLVVLLLIILAQPTPVNTWEMCMQYFNLSLHNCTMAVLA